MRWKRKHVANAADFAFLGGHIKFGLETEHRSLAFGVHLLDQGFRGFAGFLHANWALGLAQDFESDATVSWS